jgi:hypothetical protein
LIGTTNLDAERPVIWDMGRIATSGSPDALQLFRTVLLASAAIPAVFPPGFIKVAVEGAVYDEMHVDGGTTREVFLVPTQFMASRVDGGLGINPIRCADIIRNGHVAPEYKAVKARTLSIAGRAVSSLIKSQGSAISTNCTCSPRRTASTTTSLIFPATSSIPAPVPSTRST